MLGYSMGLLMDGADDLCSILFRWTLVQKQNTWVTSNTHSFSHSFIYSSIHPLVSVPSWHGHHVPGLSREALGSPVRIPARQRTTGQTNAQQQPLLIKDRKGKEGLSVAQCGMTNTDVPSSVFKYTVRVHVKLMSRAQVQ
jgi:hypothetical protein